MALKLFFIFKITIFSSLTKMAIETTKNDQEKTVREAPTCRYSERIRLVTLNYYIIGQARPKKGEVRLAFWSSRSSEYEGTACAQIRGLSAQSPTDLTRPSGTPGAQAHACDV